MLGCVVSISGYIATVFMNIIFSHISYCLHYYCCSEKNFPT